MAWFLPVGGTSTLPPRLDDSLRARGLVPGGPGGSPEPGLIVAPAPSAALLDVVGDVSRSGARTLVALTGDGFPDDPWALLAAGADDVVQLTPDRGLDDAVARLERWSEVEVVMASDTVRRSALGTSRPWQTALREVVEVARFTNAAMLITGETGTGKEVIARLVHALDRRADLGELVLVDCTTVVPALSGSEFFGHEKGSFTGAASSRVGAFARANRGTLFLDEVGELPLALQAELLRVVQEGLFKPVGGNEWRSTSFRLVAATNRCLLEEQRVGRFRSDLYFRLAGAMIHLPPLRERREDVVPLFKHFFSEARADRLVPGLVPGVARLLEERPYPGNVRELRQLAVRVASRHVGRGPVSPGDISPSDRPAGPPVGAIEADGTGEPVDPSPQSDALDVLEGAIRTALAGGLGLKDLKLAVPDLALKIALERAGGPTAAARLLGVSRRAVDYRKATGGRPNHSAPASGGV